MNNFQDLITELSRHPKDHYAEILSQLNFLAAELKPYLHYSSEFYARNLVHRSNDFELLVLCWAENQITPIHDHARSDCWMAGLLGEVEEVQYSMIKGTLGKCILNQSKTSRVKKGNVYFINDNINLHSIRNVEPSYSATLHLYSPPIKTCNFWNETFSEMRERHLKNYSEYGKVLVTN